LSAPVTDLQAEYEFVCASKVIIVICCVTHKLRSTLAVRLYGSDGSLKYNTK